MEITPREINEKQFRDAWRGYNQEEVDDFLDLVAETLETTQQENTALRGRNIELEQALATTKDTEEMLKKTLVTAQRAAEEAIAKAKLKAEQLVTEAEKRARGANQEARKIIESAEEDARRARQEEERKGEAKRRDLDAAIGRLSSYQSDLQEKLRNFLVEQQKALETLAAQEPPSAGGPNGKPRNGSGSLKAAAPPAPGKVVQPGDDRVLNVTEAEREGVEHSGAGHRRGVRGLFFREE
ncbi:MAG TPA: DivIVA domain-containing protein [Rubrobacteraceae bacterium]|nr:DivIVA domain-containing protein [Rubrobacteraceae bacterium]